MLSTIEFHAIFTMYRLPRALQCRFFSKKAFELSPEVESALREKRPVVALESTIITHGMPHPSNLTTAIAVQDIIRAQNAIPALVAVMNGTIKVGLSNKQIEELADPKSKAVKTSRRDFPYVISNKLNGGTTVSGTLFVCSSVGIDIFVTGGIGGVHRDGEVSLDISADLVELGRHSIMVVSSGVKSILDIERTLEYLETEGVCVVTYGSSKNFPAFYSEESGQLSPYHVMEPHQAAKLLHSSKQIGLDSGILLAVPVPNQFSIDLKEMNTVINLALDAAEQQGINGKNVTPFVLDKVSQLTKGKSLETNIALIKNNAHIGAKVAVEYTKLNKMSPPGVPPVIQKDNKRPVVIGGSVLDCALTICDELQSRGYRVDYSAAERWSGEVGIQIEDNKITMCANIDTQSYQ
ncbi:uncharacterized protein LOC106664206 isoform X1 [Cimex lectularius]|uniref:Pseudouridine-5'-phosphate glycosidase n=1 Tax=Cimex lectularius TaxID=79782 RepID=A0A8I6SJY7_CIMLE|nr:uncharacterized protein LOC106664206 isoform X1 [Cimex lectularius]XP_024083795.1 uncharacterized protein LOC106664206 isoform X1 [Cimex lectularius]XP_024083796.1 uncharacterized protein LOC106664206 isoform X1 [Cimex lectularius]